MYSIRIEFQGASRWYKAESYLDARALIDLLSGEINIIELWQGANKIGNYGLAAETIVHPETREVVLAKGEPVSREKMDELEALGVDQIKIYW